MKATPQFLIAALLTFSCVSAAPAPPPATRPADERTARPTNTRPARGERHPERLKAGDVAPDFALPDPNGKTEIKLSDLLQKKKPVVLVFCSYTCPPFRGYSPQLERLF